MSCDERPQATRGQDRETQELAESLTNSKKWVSILDPGVFFFFFIFSLEQSWETGKAGHCGSVSLNTLESAPGSEVWCRCNSRGHLISAAHSCEADANRQRFCYWSRELSSCLPRSGGLAEHVVGEWPN